MTVSTLPNRVQTQGDAATTLFSFNFKVFQASDLTVYKVTRSTGATTLQVLDTDYTVAITAGVDGGTVTYTTAPLTTEDSLIVREMDITQATEYPVESNLPEITFENSLDKLTMIAQQIVERLDRSLSLAISSTTTDLTIPEPAAGKALLWNATADALENSTDDFDDIVTDATTQATASAASASVAALVATNAATSAINAATSATNAGTSETNAAASAAAAASSAAEGLFNDVVTKTFGDSPVTPLVTEEGTLFRCDTSGGSITINLDTLANYDEDMKFAFVKITGDANTATINRGGTDTINAGTSIVISDQWVVNSIVGDSATGNWVQVIHSASIADRAVTTAKLADDAVTGDKIADDVVDGDHIADDAVDSQHIAAAAIDTEHVSTEVLELLGGQFLTAHSMAGEANKVLISEDLRSKVLEISVSLQIASNSQLFYIGGAGDNQLCHGINMSGANQNGFAPNNTSGHSANSCSARGVWYTQSGISAPGGTATFSVGAFPIIDVSDDGASNFDTDCYLYVDSTTGYLTLHLGTIGGGTNEVGMMLYVREISETSNLGAL